MPHPRFIPRIALTLSFSPSIDPPYPAYGGIFREEAIMLLRRFYIQENDKAPEPKQKRNRELKTEILPLDKAKIAAVAVTGKENVKSTSPALGQENVKPGSSKQSMEDLGKKLQSANLVAIPRQM